MDLKAQRRLAKITFWVGQVIGSAMILLLLIFMGGTLFTEIRDQLIDFREDYSVFLFFLGEVFIAVAFIISWKRTKIGAYLVLALVVLISVIWGIEDINFIILHIPLFVSGMLLLFYAYYKERIDEKEEST